MTISTTRDNEQTIGTLVSDAYRMASLLGDHQTLDTARMNKGMRALERICKSPEFNGAVARVVAPYILDIDADDGAYSLPSYVITPLGDAGFYLDDETQETPVIQSNRQQYQAIGDKAVTGERPTSYFADRTTDPVSVYLYPVPTAAGSLRLQVQRLRADVTSSTATLDLERHWHEAVMMALAHKLALSAGLPMNRVEYIGNEAKAGTKLAYDESSQQVTVRARVNHPTPWSR